MNELSWLIYAADVAGDANAVCAFVAYGGAIGTATYALGKGICKVVTAYDNDDPVTPSLGSVAKKIWVPVLAATVIGVLVPGRETLYAIAASEMGERVIQSETGGKAVDALNAWLDRQIEAPATDAAQ